MARALAILLALSLLVYTTSAALPRFSSYDFKYKVRDPFSWGCISVVLVLL